MQKLIYKDYKGTKLSMLGMGAMRLPVLAGGGIDEEQTARMVDWAMAHGVNYYDTAWGYHGGDSERVMGRALARYPRESYALATKFPGYDLANMDRVEEIFEAQLEKCGVEYFDFYLLHNVCELNIDEYLDERHGIMDYLRRQKAAGRIRHLGFSAHGSVAVMTRFLDAYGDEMEFGQIQLNYLDWTFQNARGKAALLNERNIPIWVMEPLRGGRLAGLEEQHAGALRAMRPDESAHAWAFRFLQAVPGVTVILSGMSSFEQMQDNVRIFESDSPLGAQETEAVLAIADDMLKKQVLPCTACRYCTDHCPQGLDIPALLELYNEHRFTGGGFIAPMALRAIAPEKQPSACIGCRSCESVCPQQIKISEAMTDFGVRLGR